MEEATIESVEDSLKTLREKLKVAKSLHAQNSIVSLRVTTSSQDSSDATFLEIFAGAAGLTAAVKRKGGIAVDACDIQTGAEMIEEFDLLKTESFKKLKKMIKLRKIRWLHLAPPCKTFSRARRRDRWAKVRRLRSASKPEGFEPKPKLVRDANLLAARSAQLATLQYKTGGWFSIENPWSSFIWLYKPLVRLSKLPGVRLSPGDQCMFGGEYCKPTGWLSNAPHIQRIAVTRPGGEGHDHPLLEGLTQDFWGEWVWKTSLAAEYPQGLCEVLAEEYLKVVGQAGCRGPLVFKSVKDDDISKRHDSKSQMREQENERSIGGMIHNFEEA